MSRFFALGPLAFGAVAVVGADFFAAVFFAAVFFAAVFLVFTAMSTPELAFDHFACLRPAAGETPRYSCALKMTSARSASTPMSARSGPPTGGHRPGAPLLSIATGAGTPPVTAE